MAIDAAWIARLLAALLAAMTFTGCGSKKDAEEKQRLQQEEEAARAEAQANQAITNMNQKMFRAMNAQPTAPAASPTPSASPTSNPPNPEQWKSSFQPLSRTSRAS